MRKAKDPLEVDHRDRGCNLSPVCLECHLPRCPDDRPYGKADMRKSSRDVEMLNLREKGWLIRELAARFNISDRTVYRTLRLFKTADVKGERHAG